MLASQDPPEAAVAFDENFIRQCYAARGLEIHEPVRYGNWCGRKEALSYQDILLAAMKREMLAS